MAEPNLKLVQREMALFAAEGQYDWRRVLGADLALLVSLPVVQKQLATTETPEIDPDAELDAIVAATKEAIEHLRQPFRDAALEQFGFTDPNPEAPRKKGARETNAAERLGISKRTYELPSAKYRGASPHDHVVGLVASALCDRARSTISRRRITRWPAALGGGLALCALILAVTLPGNDEGQVHTSTVDIGRAFAQPPKRSRVTVETGEELAGITLEACTATAGCGAPSARPTAAQRPGDLVSFRLDLNDSYQEPIATMSLTASTATHNGFTDVTVVAEWRPPLATSAIESRTATARVALQPATPAGLPRLDYVPGTTKLYTLVDTPVAEEVPALNLPDGLFASSGITLEQVGPRRQHPVVRFADVGNIHFDMRFAIAKP